MLQGPLFFRKDGLHFLMKILIVGAGGREHALTWKIAQSPLVSALFCAPGNGGMDEIATPLAIGAEDVEALVRWCEAEQPGLVVIGPEAPLVQGLADRLAALNIPAFGPSAAAAELEGSKGFMKDLCAKHGIPTAAYARFSNKDEARAYVERQGAPIVIKADGLAAGKGVTVAETLDQALDAIEACFDGAFGDAGHEVVVEEFMTGEEASVFALSDGSHALLLATAQDHKRVHDGDQGPNTGGMGAYSPAPVMTDALLEQTRTEIIEPTIKAMAEAGAPYRGVLYAGLMITDQGPKLIEYNVRFGDPECQVLMMRMKSDIVPALLACAQADLGGVTLDWHDEAAITIVMAANGYPGSYEKGTEISGLSEAASDPAVEIFHAGTKRDGDVLRAAGGRVLNVTARGKNVTDAQKRAYDALDKITWDDGFARRDIGWRAIARETDS